MSEVSKYRPILDRILVKAVNEDDIESESGMQIPTQYRQQNNKGIVIKLGQFVVIGMVRVPLTEVLSVGDKVIFGEYNCEKLKLDGEDYEIVRVQDIRVVEEKDSEDKNATQG